MAWILPITAQAAEENLVPTKVTADRLTYSQEGNRAVFEGKVHVVRQDIELWADRIEIDLRPNGDDKSGASGPDMAFATTEGASRINRIIALGNVRMRRGQSEGKCRKATYLADKSMIILEGDPVLKEGDNTLQGKEIRIYINENRSEVIGNTKRPVEMIFVTPEKGAEKKK
ncbi:MAG: LptA/OstA family protein [Desulfocurvibacter africanus]